MDGGSLSLVWRLAAAKSYGAVRPLSATLMEAVRNEAPILLVWGDGTGPPLDYPPTHPTQHHTKSRSTQKHA